MRDGWGTTIVRRSEGIPFRVYEPRPSSVLAILDVARGWGDRDALVASDERVTFGALGAFADRGAAALLDAGLRARDTVLLLGANSPSWVISFWSILRAGGVVVLGNAWWSPREVEHAVALTNPTIAVADASGRERLPTGLRLVDVEQLGRDGGAAAPDPPSAVEDEPAMIQFTSGSTGAPKGATLAHRSLLSLEHMLLHVSRKLPHELGDDPPRDVSLQTGPLFHIGGIQALLRAALVGGTLVFAGPRFDPATVLRLVEREQVNRWGGVPTMVSRVLAHPDMAVRDLSSLRSITLGGAPVPAALAEEVTRRFPAAGRGLSQIYGLSEAGGTLCSATGADMVARPGTVGRPLPLVEIRVIDPDARGVGEILARSPAQMIGYWRVPDDGTIEDDGWLRTGDLGWCDDEGFVYITGRRKDVIIRGGENIAAAHVEAALLEHTQVREAAVVGLPDADLGQIVGAALAVDHDVDGEELRRFLSGRLAHFEIPARWWIGRQPLPTNATGKLDKPAIVARWPEGGGRR